MKAPGERAATRHPKQFLRAARLFCPFWGLALAWLATGCFTLNTALPGALRGDVSDQDVDSVGHFQTEIHHSFTPFGLGEVPDDPIRAILLEEVKARGADGVRHLRIESYHSCSDVVTGWMTCQFVRPRTYRLSGELVRIRSAPLPGEAPSAQPKLPLVDPEERQGTETPGEPKMTLDTEAAPGNIHY